MTSAWIRSRDLPPSTRNPKGARRFQVLYRQGGREYPIEASGTWATMREAKIRRDLIAGYLAAGLNPKVELAKRTVAPVAAMTVREAAGRYERSRIDYSASTAAGAHSHIRRLLASGLVGRPVDSVTVSDLSELVDDWITEGLKASSIARYMTTVRLILDFAGVDPNPARDKRLKLPTVVNVEASPPTADQFLALLQRTPRQYWLPLVTLEQTGMRVGEASSLAWGDVDEQGCRFRLRSAETKTRKARWVQVPGWLMTIIAASLPREDRTDQRRVFPGFTPAGAGHAMRRACAAGGLPSFSPHDLRHRRGTIWHQDPAITIREQMDRGGWTRSDIAIETYSHLMSLDEVPADTLRSLLVMPR